MSVVCDGRSSAAAPSLASQRLRGSTRFTPRPAPPPIPETVEDDNLISPAPADQTVTNTKDRGKKKPESRVGNLFGIIDTEKLYSVFGHHRSDHQPSSAEDRLVISGVATEQQSSERRASMSSRQSPSQSSRSRLSGSDVASIAGAVSLALLIIAHSSPSWLVSWQDTNSPFTRMGPWQVCFNRFRFPRLQFDVLFHGCHGIWSYTYHQIREWLMPPWLLATQGLLILCLIFSVLSRVCSVMVTFQTPQTVWLRFGYYFILVNVGLDLVSGLLLLIITIMFAVSCWSRSWLLYPNYNYLSWGWAACLLSSWSHLLSSGLFLGEARREKLRKSENEELLFQLEPGHIFSTNNSGIM